MQRKLARIDEEDEPASREEDLEVKLAKAKLRSELIARIDDALQTKNDAAIEAFERNQHRRLQLLCPPE